MLLLLGPQAPPRRQALSQALCERGLFRSSSLTWQMSKWQSAEMNLILVSGLLTTLSLHKVFLSGPAGPSSLVS